MSEGDTWKNSVGIPAAVAGAVGAALIAGVGPELWKWIFTTKPPIEYAVKVFSTAASSPPLAQAVVRLEISGSNFGPNETDPNGVSLIPLDAKYADQAATVVVERTGYESRRKPVKLPISSASHSIYLTPQAVAVSLPPPARASAELPTAVASATLPPAGQPLPTSVSAAPVEFARVQSSGPRASGLGSNFSEWYEVCSEPGPQGYVLKAVEFRLEGDRSCGAWAECRESRRTPEETCYQFKLQGHSEWYPPTPAYTQGILRTVFSRQ